MLRLIALALCLLPALALAQDRRPSHCIAIADALPEARYIRLASLHAPPEDEFTVRIRYIDHSMFLIQTPGGLNVVTDYNGFIGTVDLVPDVVTMNIAHTTHWTAAPDPRIPHVLQGWRTAMVPAEHHLDLDEMLIRNVTTDIRGGIGGDRIAENNSIFIFEVAGLCIGHLGHLHHEPNEEDYAAIGRLDVLMVVVDGGMTIDIPTVVKVVDRLRSSIILPMHWFSGFSLDRFASALPEGFAVEREGRKALEVSLRTLPDRPTVVVIEPEFLRRDE